jgi:hypothetical protein
MTRQSAAAPAIFAVIVAANAPQAVEMIINQVMIIDDGTNGAAPGSPHSDLVQTPLGHPLALDPTEEPAAVTAHIYLPVITR